MGKKSRNKGKRGEREAAKMLSRLLGVEVVRGRQFKGSDDSPDVSGLQDYGLHVEVKRDERTASKSLYSAVEQAVNESGVLIPVVVTRRNYEDWLVAIRAEDLPRFAAAIIESMTDGGESRSDKDPD